MPSLPSRYATKSARASGDRARLADQVCLLTQDAQGNDYPERAQTAGHSTRLGSHSLSDGMCQTYKPWHDKQTHKTFLKPDQSKCLHYYFYFIDEELGRCHLRVLTWAPFRLQFYFNAHHWLAGQLQANGIAFT